MKRILYIIAWLFPLLCNAQVKSSASLIFVSPDSLQRQVSGLGLPTDTSNAVHAAAIYESYLQYFAATGINQLSFNTPLPFEGYTEGMTFVIKTAAANTDSVSININGLGEKRLLNDHFVKLRSGNLQPGQLYKITYNGNDFVLLSESDKGCPNAFVEVNSSYCIEINEHSPTTYFNASVTCYNMQARLCTWSEWHYACKKSGLGLAALTNNYEFIDDSHDHGGFISLVSGTSGCQAFNSLDATTTNNAYRCCYRK